MKELEVNFGSQIDPQIESILRHSMLTPIELKRNEIGVNFRTFRQNSGHPEAFTYLKAAMVADQQLEQMEKAQ